MLIDDFAGPGLRAPGGNAWRAVSDKVMGGVSTPALKREVFQGRACLRLSGAVRLDNNGGFIQASLALAADGDDFDASAYRGLRLIVQGNGETYAVHLRSADLQRPWQSWRAAFVAAAEWRELHLAFEDFQPHRHAYPLDLRRLRRIGLVAIGREFVADLRVAELGLYD